MTAETIPIDAFSDVTRLSKKALYCYEKKGLLVPVERDICTGYRYYSPAQIERGIWIGNLCSLGFSLRSSTWWPEIRIQESSPFFCKSHPFIMSTLQGQNRESGYEWNINGASKA